MRIVGRYELFDAIGHGGMAVVYRARQTDLDREVALKELRVFQTPDNPSLAERFLREARVAGSMSHPNIVTVHEYFKHAGTPYIAMEYLQRGSLRPWVGRMTVAQIIGVLEGLLAALDHAERYRIVHRDLKPENLLVTDHGQIKVADFGIAKARTMNTNALLTADGTTVGTPTYMAPEQAMAQELGPYTDLYSTGVLAYELFTGRVPFADTQTPVAIILRHINEQIPPAHTVNPSIDRALSDWIDRLLIKDPTRRTQVAEQAWDELEEVSVRLIGSRWRREARLARASEHRPERPLTPAPFTSTGPATPVPEQPPETEPSSEQRSDGFESFAWRPPSPMVPIDPLGASAADLDAARPIEPEVVKPAFEPEPEPEPVPEPRPPDPEPEPRFVTFGEPAPAPGRTGQSRAAPAHPARERLSRTPPEGLPQPAAAAAVPRSAPPVAEPEPREPVRPAPVSAEVAETAADDARTVMPDAVPAPPPAPARSPPSPQIRRRRRLALVGVGAVLTAAVAAGMLARGDDSRRPDASTPPPATFTLARDDVALTLPTSWSRRDSPMIPGLPPATTVAAHARGGAYVVLGHVPGATDPSLLPPKLVSALPGDIPKPKTVTLARAPAYRYDALRPRGTSGVLRVYAVLTQSAVALVLCGDSRGAVAAATATAECERVANTLKLSSDAAVPIGATDEYSAVLKRALGKLRARLTAAQARLEKAGRLVDEQSAALQRFASAYEAARASLRRERRLNPVDKGLNARLVSVLGAVAPAYGNLERAVRRRDAAGRSRGRRALTRTRARVDFANTKLASAGYEHRLPTTPAPSVPQPQPALQQQPAPRQQSTPQPQSAPQRQPQPQPSGSGEG